MADHALKIHEQPFNDLLSGAKSCEVRNNDRGFQADDTVQLHEIADTFTGRVMARKITHVQTGYGLPDGLCVLSYAHAASQGGEAVAQVSIDADGNNRRLTWYSTKAMQETPVWTKLYTHPADQVAEPDADKLAQFIRQIDGDNRMGAGALAEHICEWLAKP